MITQMTYYSVTTKFQLPGQKARVVTNHIYANSKGEAKEKALRMAKTAAFISAGSEAALNVKVEILDLF